ncbi:MAG: polyhydroxyalkanoic acid system family protein, partial [Candidatus Liptonbacteria bacterium]|nr:polyhydroxyalkanoic acid system family protein [Candidatus Liptonbacteria bacterium]
REEWNGNLNRFSFSAMGFSVSGTITVKQSTAELSVTLPVALLLCKGRIEDTIRERAEAMFA